jgi:3-isopropylmalate/(R)-2-methylmalate dehydratase small subunit
MYINFCEGKVWKFGDNVSTDLIQPNRYFHLRSDLEELAKYTLIDANPEFAKKVQKGDIIVAGRNFACGSTRESAAVIIKLSGVEVILAKSFGRIFYRTGINNGMILIQCESDNIQAGEIILVDLEKGEVRKKDDPSFKIAFQLDDIQKKLFMEGGLLNYVEKYNNLPVG